MEAVQFKLLAPLLLVLCLVVPLTLATDVKYCGQSLSLSKLFEFSESINDFLLDNLYHFDHFIIRNSGAFLFIVTDMSE